METKLNTTNTTTTNLLTKKEIREIYKDDPKTLFLLGISITSDGADDNEVVDLNMLNDDDVDNYYYDEEDEFDCSSGDDDLTILQREGY